jgi:hypothetical protein
MKDKAYPFSHKHPTTGITTSSEGMDLRDLFAIAALPVVHEVSGGFWRLKAENAYKLADEMMRVRSKTNDQS